MKFIVERKNIQISMCISILFEECCSRLKISFSGVWKIVIWVKIMLDSFVSAVLGGKESYKADGHPVKKRRE